MKIRWSIVFLALFGVVAALAAAVLTAMLSAQGSQAASSGAPKEVTILVAGRDMRAMETVRQEDLVERDPHGLGPFAIDVHIHLGRARAKRAVQTDQSWLLVARFGQIIDPEKRAETI